MVAAGVTFLATSQALAQTRTSSPMSGLAQAIAQKFNLDQSQVQSVISNYMQQQRANFQQNAQQRLKSRLDQEVSSGKITSTQEQAIINELNSLRSQNNPGSMQNLTPQQRQQAWQNQQAALKSWAQSQGINPSLIPGINGFGFRIHPRGTKSS